MNFVMGSSCFLQPPLYQSLMFSSSYSPCLLFSSHTKNAEPKKKSKNKSTTAIASQRPENFNDTKWCRRRGIFLVGISYFSFIQSRTRAVDAWTKEEQSIRMPQGEGADTPKNLQKEQVHQGEAQPNPLVALLNVIGVLGSGVLYAFYLLAQKEKATAEATIESVHLNGLGVFSTRAWFEMQVNTKVSKKEAAMVSLQSSSERMLLDKKEQWAKQITKAKEEQQSLLEELASANNTVTGLQKELQSERKLVGELKPQMDRIQTDLRKVVEDKNMLETNLEEKVDSIKLLKQRINLLSLETKEKEDNIRNLSSSLVEKEMDCKNMDSIYKQAKADIAEANFEMKAVREQLFWTKKELDLKNTAVDDLNSRVHSLKAERGDTNRKFDGLLEDYNDLKVSFGNKAASDAELLAKREQKLLQLEERLELAVKEVNSNRASIANLMQQRDDLKKMLEIEVCNVKNLKHEFQITEKTFGVSRVQVSDLSKELKQSRKLCEELDSQVSKVRTDFTKAEESLKKSLDEARSTSEVLSVELASAKALLKKTKEELQIMSGELAAVKETHDNLKKELADSNKKAESAAHDLKEEKQRAASLKEELEASEKKILKDKEARESLEMDLEEATKLLNEMNRNDLLLSRDLEMANIGIANLEDEKNILYKSLVERKNVSQEARENVEDAHNLIMKLGKERGSYEKKAKRLEEELASAQGEILRLSRQISSSRTLVNDQHQEKITGEGNNAVAVKRNRNIWKRKGGTQSDTSKP